MKEAKIEKKNPIELEIDGTVYTLDFTRKSIGEAENEGFVLNDSFGQKPMSDILNLFFYSFRAHHPEVTREEADRILDDLGGIPNEMVERLVELYSAQYLSVFQNGNEKNAKVKVRL